MKGSNGASNHVNGAVKGKAAPDTASCPACGSPISAEQYERILRIDQARKKALDEERASLDKDREAIESEHEAIEKEREAIADDAVEAARASWNVDKARILKEVERIEKKAQKEQQQLARAREKERKALDRQLASERTKMREAADARIRAATRKAAGEQDAELAHMKTQLKTSETRRAREEAGYKKVIGDLQRKVEARDREHLGPEGEEALVETLRADFPGDRVERHGKGGDVVHVVMDAGAPVGTIVYEAKNRTSWSSDYVKQTQLAMEKHDTPYGILVSRVLPAPKNGMCVMRGVIVVAPFIAAQVAGVVRDGMVAIHRLKLSDTDKGAKTAALFEYLRGQDFATAMKRIATKLGELRTSLAREKSMHDGWWRGREQHYAAIARETNAIDGRVKDLLGGRGVAKTNGKRHLEIASSA